MNQATVEVWELDSNRQVQSLTSNALYITIPGIGLSPDGNLLAAAVCREKDESDQCVVADIELWDLTAGTITHTLSGHQGEIMGVAFSPDGTWLASGSIDRTVRLWEVATGELLFVLEGNNIRVGEGGVSVACGQEVMAVAFSPDGKWLAAGNLHGDLYVWNVEALRAAPKGTLSTTVNALNSASATVIYDVDFSPDSTILAAARMDGAVHLWDAATHKLARVLTGSGMYSAIDVEISPVQPIVATTGCSTETCDTGVLALHHRETGELLAEFPADNLSWSLEFNPSGTLLALTGKTGGIRLWGIGEAAGTADTAGTTAETTPSPHRPPLT